MKQIILIIIITTFCVANEPITPIPQTISYDKQKALLGKKLFFDTILSKDDSISCSSCHDVYSNGADTVSFSVGFNKIKGLINTPTVFNSIFNFKQFWNGRAKNLKDQAKTALYNPIEHNMNKKAIETKLNQNSVYIQLFHKVYENNTISINEVVEVIAEYEKTLITPNSKFDKYLRGEVNLSKNEKDGYKLFKDYGCISCHNGVNIGGNSFQAFGVLESYDKDKREYPDRKSITGYPSDKNVFKVPTLRNISKTAPYLHNGSILKLKDVVAVMGKYNLGIEISKKDIKLIEIFLYTLDAKVPEEIK